MCCSVKRTRIQQVLHDRQIKEQDFTETFLRRKVGFTITDVNKTQWFKATAWRFTNLAHVVEIREDRKMYKAGKAGKQQPVSRGAPAPKKARHGSSTSRRASVLPARSACLERETIVMAGK